ncbi:MAG: TonB system transport protein ExbD [Motiliproteus sp.]|nr:TonB system transport protein ExbD [Motiliproteus sp.]MCW9054322.1 TonB system transport protein ExbD [Motiliproteus sp.]
MKRFDQINVIPFIDIMLVLLAIVLTTATFVAQGKIPIELPKADNTETYSSERAITITVDAAGKFYLDGDQYDQNQISDKLAVLPKDSLMVLKVDQAAAFNAFVTVADLLKEHGLDKVSILAEKG